MLQKITAVKDQLRLAKATKRRSLRKACSSKGVNHQSYLPPPPPLPLTDRFRVRSALIAWNLTLASTGALAVMILADSHPQCWFNLVLMRPFAASESQFCSSRSNTSRLRHLGCQMEFSSSNRLKPE